MHQPQPLHLSLSSTMLPVSSDCESASLGHAATQAGSSQSLQVTAMLATWLTRTARMRDLFGLNAFSLFIEQAYSQIWQPTHFSVLFQAEDGIRVTSVTGVQTGALPI